MKIVLDTNVLIAAHIAQGHCADVFEQVVTQHTLVLSDGILEELDRNLRKKFGYTVAESKTVLHFVTTHAFIVHEVPVLPKRFSRDSADDHVLALAVKAKCDLLITGDLDLLVLKSFKRIPIITPREFWKFEGTHR